MKDKIISLFFDGKFTLPLKYINILSYYLVPSFLVLSIGVLYALGQDKYLFDYGKTLGEYAWSVLSFLLFIKPVSQIFFDTRILTNILALRRQMGVLMFWLFLGHYVSMFYKLGLSKMIDLVQKNGISSYILWGAFAGFIIFLLGISSNTKSVRLLKRNWKRLHFLIYPAFLFAALHIYFIKEDISPLLLVCIYICVKFIAFKGVKIEFKKYFLTT